MKSTGRKLILISFMLAILAALAVYLYLNSLGAPKIKVQEKTILVASKTIPGRTLITKDMIQEMKVKEDSLFNSYITDSSKIIGKYTKETILAKEGFRKEKLIEDEKDDVTFKVDENHREISVNLPVESGVSKLLKPGDHVDVIAYLPEKVENQVIVRPDTSKIILENIEIIAIDEETVRSDGTADTKSKKDEKIPTSFLVTLSVETKDVEKIVLSKSIGSITLALRPLKGENIDSTEGTVWQGLTSSTAKDNNNDNADKYTSYTVKRGDTLRNISEAFYGDRDKYVLIQTENNIKNENLIEPGDVLKIPKIDQ